MQEIEEILKKPKRKLIVSMHEIDLEKNDDNKIFILMVEESLGSAGGRGGGSGHRKIDRIIGFNSHNNSINKYFDTLDQEKIVKFEIPYSAVAMDIKMFDSRQLVIQGIVDPDLIKEYEKIVEEYNIGK